MIYANGSHVDINDNQPINELMSEFTTAGQALVRHIKNERFTKKFVQELFDIAFMKIQEDIENGSK